MIVGIFKMLVKGRGVALENIRLELQEQVKKLKKQNKLAEAARLEQRTNYDLEMIEESGYCHGIENYSRHFEFRNPGDPPYTLLDYFGDDFLMFVDESHLTLSQVRAMSQQDKVRKESLISHGFRLPSAIDNRPLTFEEVYKRVPQFVYVSATPGNFELEQAYPHIIEQLIRPTGLVEPSTEVRPTENQIQDLMKEIQENIKKNQRSLVITLTKRLAEEIASYLLDKGIKTEWLHSEVKTLERPAILENLRKGTYDVLVGINLLREGLDLPEVALVAILDADKEGFLRNETTLIQTMGRAARHPNGKIIMYAVKVTGSMKNAIKEVDRRRRIQEKYNKEHNITPKAIEKAIKEWPFSQKQKGAIDDLEGAQDIELLESEMKQAADNLDFERAASVRDLIEKLKKK
ncbi:UvrB/UvrC motif-containing protein [Patescibacteria group bacterium]|nr:UvrB/UvrC motif-containing protein [Patescibacteria group bacterium]